MIQALNPKDARVLIVEDSPNDQEIASRALKTFGIRHWQVSKRAEDALEEVKKREYDVVFVDYNLPGMNGLQFLESLRQYWPDTSVIVVTGARQESVAVAAMKLGAADYISKDEFLTSGIIRALQAALRQRAASGQSEQRTALTGQGRVLQESLIEATWLIQALDARHGYLPELPASREPLSEDWADIVEMLHAYIDASWASFPDPATEIEDALLRNVTDRGLSPRDLIRLFTAVLRDLVIEAASSEQEKTPLRPLLFLTHIFACLVEEMQIVISIQEMAHHEVS